MLLSPGLNGPRARQVTDILGQHNLRHALLAANHIHENRHFLGIVNHGRG